MNEIKKFENTIDIFVTQNELEPADAIMVKKNSFKLLNHYIIYLGKMYNEHKFMAYTLSGVKLYNYRELMAEMRYFEPIRIEKFIGTYNERMEAVNRAFSRKDERSYNLILNNCEHFKNWVQYGEHKSIQVENATKLAVSIGASAALLSKNKGVVYTGLGMLFLGGLAWALNSENKIAKTESVYARKK